jgi:hypothetical protein
MEYLGQNNLIGRWYRAWVLISTQAVAKLHSSGQADRLRRYKQQRSTLPFYSYLTSWHLALITVSSLSLALNQSCAVKRSLPTEKAQGAQGLNVIALSFAS